MRSILSTVKETGTDRLTKGTEVRKLQNAPHRPTQIHFNSLLQAAFDSGMPLQLEPKA